jgi:cytoskeletal protein CcmA (bactofilin family)
MDTDKQKPEDTEDTSGSVIETDSLESSSDGTSQPTSSQPVAPPKSGPKGIKKLSHRINIYLLLFILMLVIAGGILAITMLKQSTKEDPKISSQTLSQDALSQLSKTDATVGDPKQILNVQSNAVFAGKVLIRDSLDVAGTIHVNGSLNLPGITVSGDSTFDQVQVNKTLSIGGDTSVLGQLNVKKNLSVTGGGTFGGGISAPQIATSQLQILGDLALSSHIVAGGATPTRSGGGALGGGGTASVSGSDSAGSININTGGGAAAGCYLNITFSKKFSNTPHVVITPVGSDTAAIPYYITRSTSGFSVCTTAPTPNLTLGFDYIVLG